MTRYLLGEMSEEERSQFEARFLDDPVLFEELIASEDEMMRSYVRGSGTEAERTTLEMRFLRNPASRLQLDFARSLMNYVSSVREPVQAIDQHYVAEGTHASEHQIHGPTRRPWRTGFFTGLTQRGQFVAATIILVLIAGGSWLAVSLNKAFDQMQLQHADDLRQEQEMRSQLTELDRQVKQQKEQIVQLLSMGSAVLLFEPPSRSVRQNTPQKPLVIPKGFSSIFLKFTVNGTYSSYSISLETPEGDKIWPQAGLKSWPIDRNSYGVGLMLPAGILTSSNYILILSGNTAAGNSEEVGTYAFRVIKE